MEFILFFISLIVLWMFGNAALAFVFAPFWWTKERRKRTMQIAAFVSFPVAIIFDWIFDSDD